MKCLKRATAPRIGMGYRAGLQAWIDANPPEIQCLELTAEHFFDGHAEDQLLSLRARYPLFVHGLGLSLGTPGPPDCETLNQFCRVVELSDPEWISEHVAFTRSHDVDLGHLNPVAPTEASLAVLVKNVRRLSDRCAKPVILENVTTFLQISGDMRETEFLNQLCEQADCGLLLDVTNLWINSRNHHFDPLPWLQELNPDHIVQLHVVGYSVKDGIYYDRHADPIQDELYDLVREVLEHAAVRAIVIERDVDLPPPAALAGELTRLAALSKPLARQRS